LPAFSQEQDFGVWSTLHLDKTLSDRWKFSIEEELRLKENCSQVNSYFTDLGVAYKYNKHFSVGVYYRYIRESEKELYFSSTQRFYTDLSFKYKFRRFDFTFRSRFQASRFERFFSENPKPPQEYNRNKISVSYNIRKLPLSPYISSEMFCQLNNRAGNEIDKWRHTAGIEYKVSRQAEVSVYFMIQRQVHVNDPVTSYIPGFVFSYSL
jgi:hypothetical protein